MAYQFMCLENGCASLLQHGIKQSMSTFEVVWSACGTRFPQCWLVTVGHFNTVYEGPSSGSIAWLHIF